MTKRRVVLAVTVLAAVVTLAVLFWPQPSSRSEPESTGSGAQTPPPLVERGARARPPAQQQPADASASSTREPGVVATFGWGSGEGQLGRSRPQEANPEAPMALTVDAAGTTWVLDQVNGRLVKVDRAGKPAGTVPLTLQAAQDVAVAKDGTVLVMDRLVDKAIALVGPDGRPRGELKLEGRGLSEGGASTGVFTEGDSVYVEREHGDLVRVGSTSGARDPERPEVPGRPSRDGTSYLSASIVNASAGQVLVTVIEQASRAHRFTRQLIIGPPVVMLTLLDSDRSGVIYLGALIDAAGSTPEVPRFALSITCLDPRDGRPLGHATLPANESADETFRELVVADEGGVRYLRRTEQGAQLMSADCR